MAIPSPTEGFIKMIDADQTAAAKSYLDGSVQAISYQGKLTADAQNEINVVYFANSLTHKVHQRDEYAFRQRAILSCSLQVMMTAESNTTIIVLVLHL